jgi:DNA-binding CsgD family transcriptional regulator
MKESLQIILLTGSLVTGILAIMLSYRLLHKYRLPYLSTYFYYLVFLFIFGIYGVVGARIIRVILQNQGMAAETVESAGMFITYLGIPFLVLSWYMFIRLAHELIGRNLGAGFNLLFFAPLLLGFTALGLLMVRRDLIERDPYPLIQNVLILGFTFFSLGVYGFGLAQLFIHAREFLDRNDRSNIRGFGLIYLIFAIMTVLLLNLAHVGLFIQFAFIILLFATHLISLFFMSIYLDKNFVEPAAKSEFDQSLNTFVDRYEISKRESEIIELICKGKSNQEISDSLFISLQTVKDHIHRIYLKTGVRNRVQLTNKIRTSS